MNISPNVKIPSSWKQFLLSLLATTISIAITFGTAALIDYNKKKNEKRQIVMMVMYDMYTSLKSIEKADSSISQSMEIQRQLAEDTTQFNSMTTARMGRLIPNVEYTETIERIFSSNIETINTVSNVLFTEVVASLYLMRHEYKTMICDAVKQELQQNRAFSTARGVLDFNYAQHALLSCGYLKSMQNLFAQAKQMMKVTDGEIEAYSKERANIENSLEEDGELVEEINKIIELQRSIDASAAKLKGPKK